jgi:hypothetical protein
VIWMENRVDDRKHVKGVDGGCFGAHGYNCWFSLVRQYHMLYLHFTELLRSGIASTCINVCLHLAWMALDGV